MKHEWQIGRFTGTKTCRVCGLLPLDEDDTTSPCPGTRERCADCGEWGERTGHMECQYPKDRP